MSEEYTRKGGESSFPEVSDKFTDYYDLPADLSLRTGRFFMIDRCRKDGDLHEEFSVLGSTGNVMQSCSGPCWTFSYAYLQVYTVTVNRSPSCNCKMRCSKLNG